MDSTQTQPWQQELQRYIKQAQQENLDIAWPSPQNSMKKQSWQQAFPDLTQNSMNKEPWQQDWQRLMKENMDMPQTQSWQPSITQLARKPLKYVRSKRPGKAPVTGVILRKKPTPILMLKQLRDAQQDVQAMSKRLRVIRTSKRCACKTKRGKRCKNRVKGGTFFCYLHNACKLKRKRKVYL